MFDLRGIIEKATQGQGFTRPLLAAPFDLSQHIIDQYVEKGLISGAVLDHAPKVPIASTGVGGWWIDREDGRWFLSRDAWSDMLILGCRPDYRVSSPMLLEARMKGVQRIGYVDINGRVFFALHTTEELLSRLDAARVDGMEMTFKVGYRALIEAFGDEFKLRVDELHPKKVAMLIGGLGPGGAERQLALSAAALSRDHGYDVEVICHSIAKPGDFFVPTVEDAGAKVTVLPEYHRTMYDDPVLARVHAAVADYEPLGFGNIAYSVFHYVKALHAARPILLHTWMDYCNVLGSLAAEIVGIPQIVMGGRSVNPENFPALFQPYMKPGYETAFERGAPLFLNNSWAGARDYAKWLGLDEELFRVVANGFEFPEQAPEGARERIRAELGFAEDAVVLGTVTRFSEEKNVKLFVDMAALLTKRFPDMRFVVFGTGILFDEVKAHATSLGLDDVLKMPGVTRDVWSALDAMDIFTLTSRMEGLANVLIEAQAAGVPIVCTGVGGMVETYRENEGGVSPIVRDAAGMSELVARLVQSPELRREQGEMARAWARRMFDVKVMVRSTLNAYEVAAGRASMAPYHHVPPADDAT